MSLLQILTRDELADLLREYDNYIQQANEEDLYHSGWKPVCIREFYMNEYQEILEER